MRMAKPMEPLRLSRPRITLHSHMDSLPPTSPLLSRPAVRVPRLPSGAAEGPRRGRKKKKPEVLRALSNIYNTINNRGSRLIA